MSMSSDKKILIPTDGSKYSLSAIEHALDIAKRSNAEVTALTVMDTGKVTSTLHDSSPLITNFLDGQIVRGCYLRSDRSSKEEGRND